MDKDVKKIAVIFWSFIALVYVLIIYLIYNWIYI